VSSARSGRKRRPTAPPSSGVGNSASLSTTLELNLALFEKQEDFVFSEAKFPALIAGYGAGKTHGLVARALARKMAFPRNQVGYFAPTWDLIKLIAWPRFEEVLSEFDIGYRLNRSDRYLDIEGWGRVLFRSLESALVGFEVGDSVVDELDTMAAHKASQCWNRVIARTRQRKMNGAMNTVALGTTPEGFRFAYERWEQKASERYVLYRMSTRDNYLLPEDYIPSLEETYPPQLLEAYLEGRFVNMTAGSVYPEFNRVLNACKDVPLAGEPLHIGMDFNVLNMTAIVCVIRDGLPRAVEELTRVRDTPTMAELIASRYPNRSICIYPDASGSARKSVGAGVSDLAILGAKGFRICAPNANPPVRDRVNAVNALILNAKGERRFKVNVERCPVLTNSLEKQAFDGNGEPDKSGDLDHAPDGLGYFLSYRFPIVKPVTGVLNIGFAH
jgi:hypothetical protein